MYIYSATHKHKRISETKVINLKYYHYIILIYKFYRNHLIVQTRWNTLTKSMISHYQIRIKMPISFIDAHDLRVIISLNIFNYISCLIFCSFLFVTADMFCRTNQLIKDILKLLYFFTGFCF